MNPGIKEVNKAEGYLTTISLIQLEGQRERETIKPKGGGATAR
jgi:hypothetical protein